ncbi:hypothetical protein N9U75_00850 [Pelagibacteraceae bacterium]|nr:hypothetical protein [Pelagibacteraceae bacterium]
MKNIIVQINISKKGWEEENRLNAGSEEIFILSTVLARNYAKKYNSEYKLISQPIINFKHPTWERFQFFEDKWINNYNHILYLDTDVLAWPSSPNIFEFLDNRAFNVVKHCNNKYFNNLPMFNAGVFAINKNCALKMKKYISKKIWLENFTKDPLWEDSKELNTIAQKKDIRMNWLDAKWNMKNTPNAYFTHLWGKMKKKYPNMPSILKAKILAKDIIFSSDQLKREFNITFK